jgi:hypothetical protein
MLYNIEFYGDWGLGIGDWGLGIGRNPQSPISNPQSPIPNTNFIFIQIKVISINKIKINLKNKWKKKILIT